MGPFFFFFLLFFKFPLSSQTQICLVWWDSSQNCVQCFDVGKCNRFVWLGGGGGGGGGTGVSFCMQPGKHQENYILAHGLELFRTSVIMVSG